MSQPSAFQSWQAVLDSPRSGFFRGHTADTVFDRQFSAWDCLMTEANFTQSNARVLIGQAANGAFRFISLPTQVYPAPTNEGEFGLGPGMFHKFDVATYIGDLSYRIQLEGQPLPIELSADDRDNQTVFADHYLPLTQAKQGDLDIFTLSYAPVAPDGSQAALAPAPLPGPAGAFYILHLRNTGQQTLKGKIVLSATDMLIGHYEDTRLDMRSLKKPAIDLRQGTLILTRPEGSVGIHLHGGRWTKTEAPFEAEKVFSLPPGEEIAFETMVVMGAAYSAVMPEIYNLHLRSALDWLNLTAAYWRSRLGSLQVGQDEQSRFSLDIYIRSLFDNFNCLQTDAQGNLISHWQGAPSHGYGVIWGIDVEPTAVSVVHLCPEITRQAMIFFMTRSQAPKGKPDHSIPILVAPLVMARQWLQVTGDFAFLESHPEIFPALEGIMQHLLALKAPGETLFPSRYSSDGPVGRRYDYGTNVKVWYALDSMGYLLNYAGRPEQAARYNELAREVRQAVYRTMVADGPFGPQITGGTNLGEDPGGFYLPEGVFYYDGEDTSSMLAPIYGFNNFHDPTWINYHRFARSMWCANYDPEFETLMWYPGEPAEYDGTAYLSRLGGCVTRAEMSEAIQIIQNRHVDLATGSLWWWPHGEEYRRSVTRCSQGQGAWAWQYLYQWLGLQLDAPAHLLTIAPRGLTTSFDWEDFCAGPHHFEVHWKENEDGVVLRVRNNNSEVWTVQAGFRQPAAATESALAWQNRSLASGEEAEFVYLVKSIPADPGMIQSAVIQKEAQAFAGPEGILFKRFGPVMFYGNWDSQKLWDWGAMPLALRFILLNGSQEDWQDVTVTLSVPDGWHAQGRQLHHWNKPDNMATGQVELKLPDLPAGSRTTASFWVHTPDLGAGAGLRGPLVPFHLPSQPGESVCLYSDGLSSPIDSIFTAELTVQTKNNKTIQRKLTVPFQIKPTRS
jgi:hypothetical protein